MENKVCILVAEPLKYGSSYPMTVSGGAAYAMAAADEGTMQQLIWSTIGSADANNYNAYHSQVSGGYQCEDLTDYSNLKVNVDYEKKEWIITNYKISYVYGRGNKLTGEEAENDKWAGIDGMTVKDQNGKVISNARIYSCGYQAEDREDGDEIGTNAEYPYPMSGEEFYVVIPYEGNENLEGITIDFHFKYQSDYQAHFMVYEVIGKYDSEGNLTHYGSCQPLVQFLGAGPVWAEATLTIGKNDEPKWSLEIKKVDSITGEVLPNAIFDVEIIVDGKVVETKTVQSDSEGKIYITGLTYSGQVTFRIIETQPPDGYVYMGSRVTEIVVNKEEGIDGTISKVDYNNISDEDVNLDSTEGAQKVVATIKNIPQVFFELFKISQETSEPLYGVMFGITIYKDGTELKSLTKTTDGDGILSISYKEIKEALGDSEFTGEYRFVLKEIATASGYELLEDTYIVEATVSGNDGIYTVGNLKIRDSLNQSTKMLYQTKDTTALIGITAENAISETFKLNIIKQSGTGTQLSGGKFNITLTDENGNIWYNASRLTIDGNKMLTQEDIQQYCEEFADENYYQENDNSMIGKTFQLTIEEITPPSGYRVLSTDTTFEVTFTVTENEITFSKDDRDDLIVEKMGKNIGLTVKIKNYPEPGKRPTKEISPYTINISKLLVGSETTVQESGVTFEVTLKESDGTVLEKWDTSTTTTNNEGKIRLSGLTYTGDDMILHLVERKKDGVTPTDGIYEREIRFSAACETKTVGRKTTYTYYITEYSEGYDAVEITQTNSQNITITIRNSGEPDTEGFKMDLEGGVFLDDIDGKEGNVTGIYDDGDEIVEGIEATLYYADDNGNRLEKVTDQEVQNPTRTDSNGHYSFSQLDSMKKYVVGFTYNGQDYINTTYFQGNSYENATEVSNVLAGNEGAYNTLEWSQYSKAQEENREELNHRFGTIHASPNSYTIGTDLGYNLGDMNIAYDDATIQQMYETILGKIKEGKYTTEEINQAIIEAASSEEKEETYRMLQYIEDCKITAYTDVYPAFDHFSISDKNNDVPVVSTTGNEYETYIALYDGQRQINLGIKERPNVDLRLSEDVFETKVLVNDKETTYRYNKRLADGQEASVGFYESDISSYDQYMRSTDIKFPDEYERSSDLTIDVYYKIKLTNESETYAEVTELVDYYDANFYTFTAAYLGDESGYHEELELETVPGNTIESVDGAAYGTQYIKIREEYRNVLGNNEDQYVYVKLTSKNAPESLKVLLGENAQEAVRTRNYAEINEYKTYTDKERTNTPGLVDKDSIAGNFDVKAFEESWNAETNSYSYQAEDDESAAPELFYKLPEEDDRVLQGNVFEDLRVNLSEGDINTDPLGNGKDISSLPGITDITVELVEIKDNTMKTIYTTNTDSGGDYRFNKYIPGDYVIRFTYGDKIYQVGGNDGVDEVTKTYGSQDYQSTYANPNTNQIEDTDIKYWYAEPARDENGTLQKDENGTIIYAEEEGTIKNNQTRYSDAYDEVQDRAASIQYSETMTNSNVVSLKTYSGETDSAEITNMLNGDPDLRDAITMHAYTSTLEIEVEFAKTYTNGNRQPTYLVDNIDFGLVKRAESNLELEKEVSHIKITQQDGVVLLDADVEMQGDSLVLLNYDGGVMQNDKVHFQYIPTPNAYGKGTVRFEIDDEILHASTIDITYTLTVRNTTPKETALTWYTNSGGEKVVVGYYETENEDLLHQSVYYEENQVVLHQSDGTIGRVEKDTINRNYEIVTAKADQIVDYVPNNLGFVDTKDRNNELWNLISEADRANYLRTNYDISNDLVDSINQYHTVLLANETNNRLVTTSLKPDEEVTENITLSTEMTEGIDLNYTNVVEIIKLSNTAGRVDAVSTPGNLDPVNSKVVDFEYKELHTGVDGDRHIQYDDDTIGVNYRTKVSYNVNIFGSSGLRSPYTDGSSPNEYLVTDTSRTGFYEPDSAQAEHIVITDPTGENYYYYVLIGSLLVIFAVGIVCIKQFVLKKKIE